MKVFAGFLMQYFLKGWPVPILILWFSQAFPELVTGIFLSRIKSRFYASQIAFNPELLTSN
jgi:hypothetical protein